MRQFAVALRNTTPCARATCRSEWRNRLRALTDRFHRSAVVSVTRVFGQEDLRHRIHSTGCSGSCEWLAPRMSPCVPTSFAPSWRVSLSRSSAPSLLAAPWSAPLLKEALQAAVRSVINICCCMCEARLILHLCSAAKGGRVKCSSDSPRPTDDATTLLLPLRYRHKLLPPFASFECFVLIAEKQARSEMREASCRGHFGKTLYTICKDRRASKVASRNKCGDRARRLLHSPLCLPHPSFLPSTFLQSIYFFNSASTYLFTHTCTSSTFTQTAPSTRAAHQ